MKLNSYFSHKICDIAKSEQTDKLKKEVYDLVLSLTRTFQPLYYKQYKGDIRDLASEFFTSFLTEKGRGEKKESLLDKWNPDITNLTYLLKVAVVRKLIDYSRSDKGERNFVENFDEDDKSKLSLDYIANITPESEETLESLDFSPEFIEEMKSKFETLSSDEQKAFFRKLKHYRNKEGGIYSNFDELFSHLEPKSAKGTIVISGKRPDYEVTFTSEDGTTTSQVIRSRNMTSLFSKLKSLYPSADIDFDKSIKDSRRYFNRYRNLSHLVIKDSDLFTSLLLISSKVKDDINDFSDVQSVLEQVTSVIYDATINGKAATVIDFNSISYVINVVYNNPTVTVTVTSPLEKEEFSWELFSSNSEFDSLLDFILTQ